MLYQAEKEQRWIQQFIWGYLLLTWLMRWWQGLLLFQLNGAPFVSVEADNTYWLINALQSPYYSIHYQSVGGFLDFLWFGISMLGLFGKHNRISSVLMSILFINYFITYNSVATHHEHTLVALLFCLPLLFVKSTKNFVLLFASIRHYALFALFAGGFWKVWRLSILHPTQMSEILKRQHLDYLVCYPEAFFTKIITFLIEYPVMSNVLWQCAWIIEIIFIIGFFTRKFDKLLGLGILLFFFLNYCIMNLLFVEFCILAFAFYPLKGIWEYYNTELAITKAK